MVKGGLRRALPAGGFDAKARRLEIETDFAMGAAFRTPLAARPTARCTTRPCGPGASRGSVAAYVARLSWPEPANELPSPE